MRKFLAAAAVVVALGTSPAKADDRAMILGYGSSHGGCGAWVTAAVPSTDDLAYDNWVLGYISALNVWAEGLPLNVTRSMPNNSVLLWAKNYCRSNPLDPVSTAAAALVRELLGQAPQASRIPSPNQLSPPDQLIPPTTIMPTTSSAFREGVADRQAWELWFNSLSGDEREGAFYWSSQRSLPAPGNCKRLGGLHTIGCEEAKARLSRSDVRRKSDPDYKAGWNSVSP